MNKSIMTGWETIKYSPVKSDYPLKAVCSSIRRVELQLFKKCFLGLAFYRYLLSQLVDISNIPEYDSDKVYSVGDRVCFDGCALESCIDDNDYPPDDWGVDRGWKWGENNQSSEDDDEDEEDFWLGANPNNNLPPTTPEETWKPIKKFKSDCLNDLWELHLRYWLAYMIIYSTIRYTTFCASSQGIVKAENGASSKELAEYKKELRVDADLELECLYDWLVEAKQKDTCDFNIEKVNEACGCAPECIEPARRKTRRIYYRKTKK